MNNMDRIRAEYNKWLSKAVEYSRELRDMTNVEIEEAFYRNLEFGTGGLRGVIGAGTNRMNVYTVAKASQGLTNYIKKKKGTSIAISYDSRTGSEHFAKVASEVFVANGLKVYLYSELMPTPCLSYAVRYYGCDAGVMITASHNPAKYNGYKVYNSEGCQITDQAAFDIQSEINKLDIFTDVLRYDYSKAVVDAKIILIDESCFDTYIDDVKRKSVLFGDEVDRNISIVYSPLNGTGLKPVVRALMESGFTNITLVKEQEKPDGVFPTCPIPNPENREAMQLGIQYATRINADIVMATDPDCDRIGIAVRNGNGYRLLTGNEMGLLLLDYVCRQRVKHNRMPANPIAIKTIVTSNLAERIASKYDVEIKNVLTGFKYIGEQIGYLENKGRTFDFIFGFEENYGYLSGVHVRDKDAVNASLMICEMFAYYKYRNIPPVEKLGSLYDEYGYEYDELRSFQFEGIEGSEQMKHIMCKFRSEKTHFGQFDILKVEDYLEGINELPVSNVIKYWLTEDVTVTVRPSGTEPKMKVYLSVVADNEFKAKTIVNTLLRIIEEEYISYALI